MKPPYKPSKQAVQITIFILIILMITSIWGAVHAFSQGTTIEISTGTHHNWTRFETTVLFRFEEPTSSVEFEWFFDDEYDFNRVEIANADSITGGYIVQFLHTNSPNVGISIALGSYQDTLQLNIYMTVRSVGTGFYGARNFLFNERGDDGLIEASDASENYPFLDHPLVVADDGWIHPDSVQTLPDSLHSIINEHYILRSNAGDLTCNGSLSALDASNVLMRVLNPVPQLPIDDFVNCPTEIIEELQ